MMVEFKWISLFLTAVLQFTAAAGKLPLSFTVRVGDEVTLPCENVIDGQQRCEYTTWIFSGSGNKPAVKLFELGQIHNEAKSKSDRLSVTENCSLVIKKVTVEDVGYYGCRQFNKSGQQAPDSLVHLSVIIMTEHQDGDKVTHKQQQQQLKTVTATTTTNDASTKLQALWWLTVFVRVAGLIIIVVVVALIRWKKTKGKKPQMDENTGRSLNPAVSPESSQDTADPEDGVSYASISYTRKTNSKGRVLGKDGDDEDDAVTYSTVKASFSADPSDLYATVNKPNK